MINLNIISTMNVGGRIAEMPDGSTLSLTGGADGKLHVLLGQMLDLAVAQQKQIITMNQTLTALVNGLEAAGADGALAAEIALVKNQLATQVIDRVNTLEQSVFKTAKAAYFLDQMSANMMSDLGRESMYNGFKAYTTKPTQDVFHLYQSMDIEQTPPPRSDADKLITGA